MRAQAADVDTVLVGGRVVLEQGQPTFFDVNNVGRELADMLASQPFPEQAACGIEALLPSIDAHYRDWEAPPLEPYNIYNSRR